MTRSDISAVVDNVAEFTDDIVETLREVFLVLDADLTVVYANRSFYEKFKVKPGQTLDKKVYDIGNKQWKIPKLKKLLEEILPLKNVFDGFEVTHTFPVIGAKVMLINARQFRDGGSPRSLILMMIEDVTEERLSQAAAIQNAKLAAVGQLSAGIAHGLSSPITGIQNFLRV